MAESTLDPNRNVRWVWVAIILMPFVGLAVDYFTGGFSILFEGTIERTLYKIIFYPAILVLPSILLACVYFTMDFFTAVMFSFCLYILSYLPLYFFGAFLACLRAGTCLDRWT